MKYHPLTIYMIIGLDIAKCTGVAYLRGNKIVTTTYEGTEQEQLQMILDVLGEDLNGYTFVIEELNHFVNAKTVRSLLLRTGYISGTLKKHGANIEYVIATQARKYLGLKKKKDALAVFPGLTQDEADAVVILLFALKKQPGDFEYESTNL